MPDTSSCTCDDVHTLAICDEVGVRLRALLDRSMTPPPPGILALLLQLQLRELETAVMERRPADDLALAS
jgi:hypothetical protein